MTLVPKTVRSPFVVWMALVITAFAALLVVVGGEIRITQAAPAQVTGGSLDWGIRASFRSYVVGPIAHGQINTSGATQNADGSFSFPVSGGTYDADTGALSVSFGGSVHFTGHDYGNGNLLDLRISNLRVDLNGGSGTLVADVESRTLASIDPNADLGPIVTYSGVTIANLSGAAVQAGNGFSWSGISASLAASGAEAFASFYQAGEPLDPVSISIQTAAPAQPTATTAAGGSATATPGASATSTPVPGSTAPQPTAASGSQQPGTGQSITVPVVGDAGLAAGR